LKTFLRVIEKHHNELVKRFSEPSLNGTIAGATITNTESDDGLPFLNYSQAAPKIKGLNKDRRQYKNDPSKIVIQVDYFRNALLLSKGYFMFIPTGNSGSTNISVPYENRYQKPKYKKIDWFVYALFFSPIAILGINTSYFYFLGLIVMIPILGLADFGLRKHADKMKANWEEFINSPSQLLSTFPYSCTSKYKGNYNSIVEININDCPFKRAYANMLSKLIDTSAQTNGKIVWLWRFDDLAKSGDSFRACYDEWESGNYFSGIKIHISLRSSYLMPAVQTENSYIFFLDEFSDEMEEAHLINPPDLKTFEKNLIERGKSIANTDSMFSTRTTYI